MPRTGQPDLQTGQSPPPPLRRDDAKSALRALLAYAKPQRRTFLLVFLCALLAIAADLLQPYLVKVAIDDHLMAGRADFAELLGIIGVYVGLTLLSFFFSYLQNNLLQYAGQTIVSSIRKDLMAHISKQSMSFFDRMSSGSLITNVSSDTETLNQFFSNVLLSLMRDSMTLIFILVILFQLDPRLTGYCFLLIPVIVSIALGFRSYMRKAYQQSRAQLSRLIAFVAENLAGMSIVQAFHQEKEQRERFTERNGGYYRASLREVGANMLFNRSFDTLGNLSVALVAWLGGEAVLNHSIEYGVMYAFISYIRQFFQPINQITQQWNTMQSTIVSMNRINSLLAIEPAIAEPELPRSIRLPVQGRIDFNRVSFAYQEDVPVIRDIDLHIRPGEMIGIAGTTGAGKSSLIGLLCRFYDVGQGAVEIDGVDVRHIPSDKLHRMIGLIQQEPYLFTGTIIDNVRLFDESISRERAIEACRFVGADTIVGRMKDGYDTMLSERGSSLSAGERQLISFARILVFEPQILVLDEATANLDSQTEQLIQNALSIVSRRRTTLVIAHRLSTIRHADRIIVMRAGRIAEEGTHAQLLARQGYYAELYRHSHGDQADEA
ncbi:ABC transporter ATP-binding protein [Cohnella thermotolerans]|uniref:ABC transporter ATP-binding protein n=1 Tax=Cohnella thermotolerans TaxID=329858 RepID=UPI00040F3BAF|nr:ABC transporter ATP-binding protein [Cohnella thermotolerans]